MIDQIATQAKLTATAAALGADPFSAVGHLLRTGRMPMIGDEVKPWRLKGWLRLLVQALHAEAGSQTGFPDRWGYLARVVAMRGLPGDPIPQVDFDNADPAVLRQTEKWLELCDKSGGQWTSYRDFARFLGWGLGVYGEDPHLSEELSEQLYRQVDLGQWLRRPSDYLGELGAIRYGGGPHKFFPTPHPICELMVRTQIAGREDTRSKSVCDPAMGSARMLLHASNRCLRLYGQDIDEVMVIIAKVNLAVYAPWGLFNLDFLEGEDVVVELPPGLV
jgi:hypothetical protein